jgi:AraC-like DNA-binding protein
MKSKRLNLQKGATSSPPENPGYRPEVADLMRSLATGEGINSTQMPGVRFLRLTKPQLRIPAIYDPGIVVVGQGMKRGYFGKRIYHYYAGNYMVLCSPIAGECEIPASPEKPMISMTIDIDLAVLGELIAGMGGEARINKGNVFKVITATELSAELSDAIVRLLKCLHSPLDCEILGPQIVREIHYLTLRSGQGNALRAIAARQSHFFQINRVLRVIHGAYAQTIDVEELACKAGMSPATFHRHFKKITFFAPHQYIKRFRLHTARMLLAHDDACVGHVASKVGYQSASQFNREFKRLYGTTPLADARLRRMRGNVDSCSVGTVSSK